ncbi:hypothetical protein [Thermococcus peptonophilus]
MKSFCGKGNPKISPLPTFSGDPMELYDVDEFWKFDLSVGLVKGGPRS